MLTIDRLGLPARLKMGLRGAALAFVDTGKSYVAGARRTSSGAPPARAER